MSAAELLIGQMAGRNEIDPVLFPPDQHALCHHHHGGIRDDGTTDALFYPLSGLSGEHKSYPAPVPYQLERAEGSLYPFNTSYLFSPTDLNPAASTSASSSNFASQTTPSSVLPTEDASDEPKKTTPKRKKNSKSTTKSTTKKASTDSPAKPALKTRRQPKREAAEVTNRAAEVHTGNKPKYRRQRSLEKNRVAASKCRKRKKQWTENLEQKESGLESVHQELQSEYLELLQESSQLKNFLISHAGCQDPNIDIWIKNEASKYVCNLHKASRLNSMQSVPSLDGDTFTARHSSIPSPTGGLSQASTDRETEELNSGEYSDEEGAFESDLED